MHKLPLRLVRLRKRSVILATSSFVAFLTLGYRLSSLAVKPLPGRENISNLKSQISDLRSQISDLKYKHDGRLAIETLAEPPAQIALSGLVNDGGYSTAQGCDTSAAPLNGEVGTCGIMLPDGISCQPSCHDGYTRSGESTCLVGVLSAATCIITQDVAANRKFGRTQKRPPLTDNTKAPPFPLPDVLSGYVATEDSSDGLPTTAPGAADTEREAIWKSFGREDEANIHVKPNGYHQRVDAFDRPCAGQLELARVKQRPVVLSQEDRGNRLRYY